MTLGPVEFVAIGVKDSNALEEILPALNTIEETGALRVVDLLVVSTDATGEVSMQEVHELWANDGSSESTITDTAPGVLSAEDVQTLAAPLPADATAVVVLLEHTWARTLTEAVQRAGGVLYTGGLISSDALTQVGSERAAIVTATAP